jgi:hypothetical protein
VEAQPRDVQLHHGVNLSLSLSLSLLVSLLFAFKKKNEAKQKEIIYLEFCSNKNGGTSSLCNTTKKN